MAWDQNNPILWRMSLQECTDSLTFWRERLLHSYREIDRLNDGVLPYTAQERELWREAENANYLKSKVNQLQTLWWGMFGKLCSLCIGSCSAFESKEL